MSRGDIFNKGNVAVITGAALGIGRAMSLKLAEMGMSVVMSDLESTDFDEAVALVTEAAQGGPETVLKVVSDVADPGQIAKLKSATLETFGRVDLLANNAAARIGRGFDADLADWRRLTEINLWGPIEGVRAFLPMLTDNSAPTCIVNVGSKQGITNPPGHPAYNMAKAALKSYSEGLEHDLRSKAKGAENRTSVHLLVPGWTTTGKAEHKPGAWLPQQVVERMIEGIKADQFYIICPDDETTSDMDNRRIIWGAQDMTENRPPLSRWHPDFKDAAKDACS